MKPDAIQVRNLSFSYDKTAILQDITFTLKQGDFLGIIGPNGGGKTTLLKLLLGILAPDKGEILVLGEAPHDAKHRIGYVPQHTDFNLRFPVSAIDIVLMGRLRRSSIGRPYSRKDRSNAEKALDRVGMAEYRHTHIGELSGGQRQRVFIARALAAMPEIFFLDEPTAGIDPHFETDLFSFLKELNKEATIVVVTHDIGVISSNVKSVACVNRTMIFHEQGKITPEMIDMAYQCPVDLVAHGLPHRVFADHEEK
ncbi:Zinc uptake system ATP-binding protein ZurA [uncultured Desulfobacterium sp.]|uniref:Zinc uptake system ATP-binding protein ZurA n=1 Tax=uncultured Desulfobacterium sp. TaxID=201089 RepID=A0A445N352_9BACT|nr:Zinc uptake system ATP-binding protein ZurA [uncultured Desulfobacterium sp.]